VVEGPAYADAPDFAAGLARAPEVAAWPLVVVHDDAGFARSAPDFLWATWTRFEPASDIHAAETTVRRHHLSYTPPVVIDARMKPGYPEELVVRPDIADLVDRRWREYFLDGGSWEDGEGS
jgi:4-hydroxybenzoate decarboxylase subunit C